jgi:hypothetical protein
MISRAKTGVQLRTMLRSLIRISPWVAGLSLLVVLGIAVTNPKRALIYVYSLAYNTHPPPLLDQFSKEQPPRSLTAYLQQRFPTGMSEGALKSALLDQGFRPYRRCHWRGQDCPSVYDPDRILEYDWGMIACGAGLIVWWTVDDSRNISKATGVFHSECL